MKTIRINGLDVQVSAETFRRIEKIAEEKKITISDAIFLCFKKVI